MCEVEEHDTVVVVVVSLYLDALQRLEVDPIYGSVGQVPSWAVFMMSDSVRHVECCMSGVCSQGRRG